VPLPVDSGLSGLFGSDDRVRTLAALANAGAPLTGYRIATMVGMEPPNVYRELNRLLACEEVKRATTPDGRNGWLMVDPDVRSLLRRRLRIVWSRDLTRGAEERERRAASIIERSAREPLDLSKFKPGRRISSAATRRRREKDEVLERAGARTSVQVVSRRT
jgi:hypothetical protein